MSISALQLVKKRPVFYATRIFITAFTTDSHLFLSWARSIQSICLMNLFKIHFNIILPSRPRSYKWYLSLRFPHNTVRISPLSHTCYMSWFLILLDWSPGQYLVRIAKHQDLHFAIPSVRLRPNAGLHIFMSALFLNIFSLCSSFNIRNQVSHPYKTIGKIKFLYILKSLFPEGQRGDHTLWPER